MCKLFIDGSEGTTGLQIRKRLAALSGFTLLELPDELRKDTAARAEMLNQADVAILCLPDAAARQAVALVQNPNTIIIDASTAHRTAQGWCYGLPELGERFAQAVATGKRIAVPGCHATGFVLLARPLVQAGLLPPGYPLTCHSVTGYSGGGKSMIANYEAASPEPSLVAPRPYALGLQHKHLPEMQHYAGLQSPPVFCPIVGNFYAGMAVTLPLQTTALTGSPTADDLLALLKATYADQGLISVWRAEEHPATAGGFLNPAYHAGSDKLDILVAGHGSQAQLIALYDNLGKGASGAAVQCLKLVAAEVFSPISTTA